MSDSREMGEMLTCAPVGRGEALVPVLCVEATARTQEALEAALQAMSAAHSSSSSAEPVAPSSSSSAAALRALHKLPGTRLRVSPYTTVHVLRGFLQSEAGAAKDAKDLLATAQFFAVRVPAAAEARVEAAAEKEAEEEEQEAMVALHAQTTLQEVLSGGGVLQLPSEDVPEATLVLLYSKETQYGDMIDACIFGFCAAIGAWFAHMCIREVSKSVSEQKQKNKEKKAQKQQEMDQQQQQQQQQYYQNPLPPQGPNSYGAPPPPQQQQPGNYQGYPAGMPPPMQQQQNNSPGSPGFISYQQQLPFQQQQHQQQQQQYQQQDQQPANGFPTSPSGPYTYSAVPPLARAAPSASSSPSSPPQQSPAAKCTAADLPPSPPPAASASAVAKSSSGDLPPAQYPSSLHAEEQQGGPSAPAMAFKADPESGAGYIKKLDSPTDKQGGSGGFDNPSCGPVASHEETSKAAAKYVTSQPPPPQYATPRADEEAPAWSWSPMSTAAEEAVWSPSSGQADGGHEKGKQSN